MQRVGDGVNPIEGILVNNTLSAAMLNVRHSLVGAPQLCDKQKGYYDRRETVEQ